MSKRARERERSNIHKAPPGRCEAVVEVATKRKFGKSEVTRADTPPASPWVSRRDMNVDKELHVVLSGRACANLTEEPRVLSEKDPATTNFKCGGEAIIGSSTRPARAQV